MKTTFVTLDHSLRPNLIEFPIGKYDLGTGEKYKQRPFKMIIV